MWIKSNFYPKLIISGGAKGVDTLAQKYAQDNNIEMKIHHAEWNKYGKSAGPIRNQLIVNDITHLLALPVKNSVGTYSTINKAKKSNKNVTIIMVTV
uniref:DNA recombination-mediator protein A n=1 Tax=Pithovirus LCPAC001 TaxID=2506585 RepID=A0A481Z4E3_9VIRU|nr:MAG: DNA recombination-mediator protein A [Pithovirus LCPAC001]